MTTCARVFVLPEKETIVQYVCVSKDIFDNYSVMK